VTNTKVQATLLRELSSAAISSPIRDAEARKLPYLQAVIKEGLRIFPPVAALFLKDVPAGGDTINDIFVPGGTAIGSSPFGLMRNTKVWGEDASLFRPERWLEGDAEEIQKKESNLDLVFGYGKYQCLGKNIARMELNKIFVEVCSFRLWRDGSCVPSFLSDLTYVAPSKLRVFDHRPHKALAFV